MKLKPVLTAEAYNQLGDAFKALYTQSGEKYVLTIDGIGEHPDVASLRTALDKERVSRTDAQREYAQLKSKIGDMDPDKAREALQRMQELADKKLIDEGQIEELFKQRTERLQTDHQNQIKGFEKKLQDGDTRYNALRNDYKKSVLENGIRQTLAGKVKSDLIEAAILKFTVAGIGGVRWDLDEKNQIVALKGDQIVFGGKDPNKPMTFDEGLDALKGEAPSFFVGSAGGGATNDAAGRAQGGAYVISDADARDPQKYQAAKAAATKAGLQLSIGS